jgi:tetratricopeptide (TPR) repeat protein
MTTSARKASIAIGGGLLLVLVTAYFGAQCAAGFAILGGQQAYYSGEFTRARNAYQRALHLGGNRETIEIDLVETLLFALDQQALGVKVTLPMPADAAVSLTRTLLWRRLSSAPYKAYYWSLASDLNLFEARQQRRQTPLDLSSLSDNPIENLLPREGIAVAALEEAARREPANYVYEDLLAEQYLEWGVADRALGHVRRSVALFPMLSGHIFLSRAPLEANILDAALAGFDDSLVADSMIPKELIECDAGSMLVAQGRFGDAVTHYKRALDRSPGLPEAQYRYGQTSYLLGNYREADEMLTRAAPQFPDSASLYYFLGLTRLKEGKKTEGIEALRTAREIDPQSIELFHALAAALESAGMLKEAERQYMAAAHLNPNRSEAWSALLDFYARHAELTSDARRACTHLEGLKIDPMVYKSKCDNLLKVGS